MAGKASSPAPTAGGRPGLASGLASPGPLSHQLTTGRALLLLAALVLIWGANWPIMKAGLSLVTPFWFAVARLLLAPSRHAPLMTACRRLEQGNGWITLLGSALAAGHRV